MCDHIPFASDGAPSIYAVGDFFDECLDLQVYNPIKDTVEMVNTMDLYDPKKFVVLFFYPADFTFVCPTELRDLNTAADHFKKAGAQVFVVSTDTVYSHKRRVETEMLLKGFQLPMIADRTGELSKMFGVYNYDTGNAQRGTIVLVPTDDIEGFDIKSVEVVADNIGRSSNELVRKLNALRFVTDNPSAACPASRNLGGPVLTPSIKIAGHVGDAMAAKKPATKAPAKPVAKKKKK